MLKVLFLKIYRCIILSDIEYKYEVWILLFVINYDVYYYRDCVLGNLISVCEKKRGKISFF